MRCLFLDVSGPTSVLACVTEEETRAYLTAERLGDDVILEEVERVLSKAQWKMEDLTHIAAVTGPGGFTSLRVGIAFLNALAFGLHIPLAGIHASDLWKAETGVEDGVWVQSTKKELLFVRGFGMLTDIWPETVTASVEDVLASLKPGTGYCGQLLPEHEARLQKKGAMRREQADSSVVLPLFLAKQAFKTASLVPWYGRGY